MNKVFGVLFVLTGIFALLGGFYTWGKGSIFDQTELIEVWIPWADIILTGPLSLICGYGVLKNLFWGKVLGLVNCGVYILGSALVYISTVWDANYTLALIIPALLGLIISIGFIVWIIQTQMGNIS